MSFQLASSQQQAKTHVDKFYVFFMVAIHTGAIAALFHWSWINVITMFVLYLISGLGITVGYHRLLTHQSFKTPKWLEYVWATAGALATQGGPITWIAQHRQHHRESDTQLDPHNIHDGFMHAHMWWIFNRYPEWYEKGVRESFAPDLMKDRYYQFLERYSYLPAIVVAVALFLVGGLELFLWGACLRTVLIYHSTWFVNSAAHIWGYRPFKKEIATNNWWVALLALGEGWHNNHHAFPTSARHGLRFWEFDLSWVSIWLLSKLGLATKIRLPEDSQLPWKQQKTASTAL